MKKILWTIIITIAATLTAVVAFHQHRAKQACSIQYQIDVELEKAADEAEKAAELAARANAASQAAQDRLKRLTDASRALEQ